MDKRYSVRQYTDEEIKDNDIIKLLKCAMQAPSAGNQQPWRFTVVKNKGKLNELSKSGPYSGFVKDASIAIVISITNDEIRYPELAEIDVGISAENILLEATKLGFGGTYVAVYPYEDRINNVKQTLNLTETPITIISLGYPKTEHQIQERFDLNKVKYVE